MASSPSHDHDSSDHINKEIEGRQDSPDDQQQGGRAKDFLNDDPDGACNACTGKGMTERCDYSYGLNIPCEPCCPDITSDAGPLWCRRWRNLGQRGSKNAQNDPRNKQHTSARGGQGSRGGGVGGRAEGGNGTLISDPALAQGAQVPAEGLLPSSESQVPKQHVGSIVQLCQELREQNEELKERYKELEQRNEELQRTIVGKDLDLQRVYVLALRIRDSVLAQPGPSTKRVRGDDTDGDGTGHVQKRAMTASRHVDVSAGARPGRTAPREPPARLFVRLPGQMRLPASGPDRVARPNQPPASRSHHTNEPARPSLPRTRNIIDDHGYIWGTSQRGRESAARVARPGIETVPQLPSLGSHSELSNVPQPSLQSEDWQSRSKRMSSIFHTQPEIIQPSVDSVSKGQHNERLDGSDHYNSSTFSEPEYPFEHNY